MDIREINPGMLVTWGRTKPTGEVVRTDLTRTEAPVVVRLVKPVTSPCGKTFPAGLEAHFSPGELSLLA